MFERCKASEQKDHCELIPFWYVESNRVDRKGYAIERIVPKYPFSRDEQQYERLVRLLSIYRISLGQARQEELLEYILQNTEEYQLENLKQLFMNLSSYYREREEKAPELASEEAKEGLVSRHSSCLVYLRGIVMSEIGKYLIRGPHSGDTVELWSTLRLPFEPKGQLVGMKNSLRAALKRVKSQNESILHAVYRSETRSFCDVENILIYNVGSGCFAHLCRKGILFERSFRPPPQAPEEFDGMAKHYHYYSQVPCATEPLYWRKALPLVDWNTVPCPPLKSDIKPHSIWYAMKQFCIEPANPVPPSPYLFGIQVSIEAPFGTLINLASTVKPLLDGIISAFHYHDGSNFSVITDGLANLTGAKHEATGRLLTDKKGAVLGPRRLLNPFGQGLQWNPADDMCMAAKLIVNVSKTDTWSTRGSLFTVEEERC